MIRVLILYLLMLLSIPVVAMNPTGHYGSTPDAATYSQPAPVRANFIPGDAVPPYVYILNQPPQWLPPTPAPASPTYLDPKQETVPTKKPLSLEERQLFERLTKNAGPIDITILKNLSEYTTHRAKQSLGSSDPQKAAQSIKMPNYSNNSEPPELKLHGSVGFLLNLKKWYGLLVDIFPEDWDFKVHRTAIGDVLPLLHIPIEHIEKILGRVYDVYPEGSPPLHRLEFDTKQRHVVVEMMPFNHYPPKNITIHYYVLTDYPGKLPVLSIDLTVVDDIQLFPWGVANIPGIGEFPMLDHTTILNHAELMLSPIIPFEKFYRLPPNQQRAHIPESSVRAFKKLKPKLNLWLALEKDKDIFPHSVKARLEILANYEISAWQPPMQPETPASPQQQKTIEPTNKKAPDNPTPTTQKKINAVGVQSKPARSSSSKKRTTLSSKQNNDGFNLEGEEPFSLHFGDTEDATDVYRRRRLEQKQPGKNPDFPLEDSEPVSFYFGEATQTYREHRKKKKAPPKQQPNTQPPAPPIPAGAITVEDLEKNILLSRVPVTEESSKAVPGVRKDKRPKRPEKTAPPCAEARVSLKHSICNSDHYHHFCDPHQEGFFEYPLPPDDFCGFHALALHRPEFTDGKALFSAFVKKCQSDREFRIRCKEALAPYKDVDPEGYPLILQNFESLCKETSAKKSAWLDIFQVPCIELFLDQTICIPGKEGFYLHAPLPENHKPAIHILFEDSTGNHFSGLVTTQHPYGAWLFEHEEKSSWSLKTGSLWRDYNTLTYLHYEGMRQETAIGISNLQTRLNKFILDNDNEDLPQDYIEGLYQFFNWKLQLNTPEHPSPKKHPITPQQSTIKPTKTSPVSYQYPPQHPGEKKQHTTSSTNKKREENNQYSLNKPVPLKRESDQQSNKMLVSTDTGNLPSMQDAQPSENRTDSNKKIGIASSPGITEPVTSKNNGTQKKTPDITSTPMTANTRNLNTLPPSDAPQKEVLNSADTPSNDAKEDIQMSEPDIQKEKKRNKKKKHKKKAFPHKKEETHIPPKKDLQKNKEPILVEMGSASTSITKEGKDTSKQSQKKEKNKATPVAKKNDSDSIPKTSKAALTHEELAEIKKRIEQLELENKQKIVQPTTTQSLPKDSPKSTLQPCISAGKQLKNRIPPKDYEHLCVIEESNESNDLSIKHNSDNHQSVLNSDLTENDELVATIAGNKNEHTRESTALPIEALPSKPRLPLCYLTNKKYINYALSECIGMPSTSPRFAGFEQIMDTPPAHEWEAVAKNCLHDYEKLAPVLRADFESILQQEQYLKKTPPFTPDWYSQREAIGRNYYLKFLQYAFIENYDEYLPFQQFIPAIRTQTHILSLLEKAAIYGYPIAITTLSTLIQTDNMDNHKSKLRYINWSILKETALHHPESIGKYKDCDILKDPFHKKFTSSFKRAKKILDLILKKQENDNNPEQSLLISKKAILLFNYIKQLAQDLGFPLTTQNVLIFSSSTLHALPTIFTIPSDHWIYLIDFLTDILSHPEAIKEEQKAATISFCEPMIYQLNIALLCLGDQDAINRLALFDPQNRDDETLHRLYNHSPWRQPVASISDSDEEDDTCADKTVQSVTVPAVTSLVSDALDNSGSFYEKNFEAAELSLMNSSSSDSEWQTCDEDEEQEDTEKQITFIEASIHEMTGIPFSSQPSLFPITESLLPSAISREQLLAAFGWNQESHNIDREINRIIQALSPCTEPGLTNTRMTGKSCLLLFLQSAGVNIIQPTSWEISLTFLQKLPTDSELYPLLEQASACQNPYAQYLLGVFSAGNPRFDAWSQQRHRALAVKAGFSQPVSLPCMEYELTTQHAFIALAEFVQHHYSKNNKLSITFKDSTKHLVPFSSQPESQKIEGIFYDEIRRNVVDYFAGRQYVAEEKRCSAKERLLLLLTMYNYPDKLTKALDALALWVEICEGTSYPSAISHIKHKTSFLLLCALQGISDNDVKKKFLGRIRLCDQSEVSYLTGEDIIYSLCTLAKSQETPTSKHLYAHKLISTYRKLVHNQCKHLKSPYPETIIDPVAIYAAWDVATHPLLFKKTLYRPAVELLCDLADNPNGNLPEELTTFAYQLACMIQLLLLDPKDSSTVEQLESIHSGYSETPLLQQLLDLKGQ